MEEKWNTTKFTNEGRNIDDLDILYNDEDIQNAKNNIPKIKHHHLKLQQLSELDDKTFEDTTIIEEQIIEDLMKKSKGCSKRVRGPRSVQNEGTEQVNKKMKGAQEKFQFTYLNFNNKNHAMLCNANKEFKHNEVMNIENFFDQCMKAEVEKEIHFKNTDVLNSGNMYEDVLHLYDMLNNKENHMEQIEKEAKEPPVEDSCISRIMPMKYLNSNNTLNDIRNNTIVIKPESKNKVELCENQMTHVNKEETQNSITFESSPSKIPENVYPLSECIFFSLENIKLLKNLFKQDKNLFLEFIHIMENLDNPLKDACAKLKNELKENQSNCSQNKNNLNQTQGDHMNSVNEQFHEESLSLDNIRRKNDLLFYDLFRLFHDLTELSDTTEQLTRCNFNGWIYKEVESSNDSEANIHLLFKLFIQTYHLKKLCNKILCMVNTQTQGGNMHERMQAILDFLQRLIDTLSEWEDLREQVLCLVIRNEVENNTQYSVSVVHLKNEKEHRETASIEKVKGRNHENQNKKKKRRTENCISEEDDESFHPLFEFRYDLLNMYLNELSQLLKTFFAFTSGSKDDSSSYVSLENMNVPKANGKQVDTRRTKGFMEISEPIGPNNRGEKSSLGLNVIRKSMNSLKNTFVNLWGSQSNEKENSQNELVGTCGSVENDLMRGVHILMFCMTQTMEKNEKLKRELHKKEKKIKRMDQHLKRYESITMPKNAQTNMESIISYGIQEEQDIVDTEKTEQDELINNMISTVNALKEQYTLNGSEEMESLEEKEVVHTCLEETDGTNGYHDTIDKDLDKCILDNEVACYYKDMLEFMEIILIKIKEIHQKRMRISINPVSNTIGKLCPHSKNMNHHELLKIIQLCQRCVAYVKRNFHEVMIKNYNGLNTLITKYLDSEKENFKKIIEICRLQKLANDYYESWETKNEEYAVACSQFKRSDEMDTSEFELLSIQNKEQEETIRQLKGKVQIYMKEIETLQMENENYKRQLVDNTLGFLNTLIKPSYTQSFPNELEGNCNNETNKWLEHYEKINGNIKDKNFDICENETREKKSEKKQEEQRQGTFSITDIQEPHNNIAVRINTSGENETWKQSYDNSSNKIIIDGSSWGEKNSDEKEMTNIKSCEIEPIEQKNQTQMSKNNGDSPFLKLRKLLQYVNKELKECNEMLIRRLEKNVTTNDLEETNDNSRNGTNTNEIDETSDLLVQFTHCRINSLRKAAGIVNDKEKEIKNKNFDLGEWDLLIREQLCLFHVLFILNNRSDDLWMRRKENIKEVSNNILTQQQNTNLIKTTHENLLFVKDKVDLNNGIVVGSSGNDTQKMSTEEIFVNSFEGKWNLKENKSIDNNREDTQPVLEHEMINNKCEINEETTNCTVGNRRGTAYRKKRRGRRRKNSVRNLNVGRKKRNNNIQTNNMSIHTVSNLNSIGVGDSTNSINMGNTGNETEGNMNDNINNNSSNNDDNNDNNRNNHVENVNKEPRTYRKRKRSSDNPVVSVYNLRSKCRKFL